jgi:hypothetical protein
MLHLLALLQMLNESALLVDQGAENGQAAKGGQGGAGHVWILPGAHRLQAFLQQRQTVFPL